MRFPAPHRVLQDGGGGGFIRDALGRAPSEWVIHQRPRGGGWEGRCAAACDGCIRIRVSTESERSCLVKMTLLAFAASICLRPLFRCFFPFGLMDDCRFRFLRKPEGAGCGSGLFVSELMEKYIRLG